MDFTERLWCGTLRPGDAGRDVVLAGWVDTLRDHGEVGGGICPDDRCLVGAAISERDLQTRPVAASAGDDVVVGQHVPGAVNDHARTFALTR